MDKQSSFDVVCGNNIAVGGLKSETPTAIAEINLNQSFVIATQYRLYVEV